MALVVEQYISVVSVFHLKQIAGDGVACAALDEVFLRSQKFLTGLGLAELLQEIVEQSGLLGFLGLMLFYLM